jgi:deoxyribonuclease-4
MSTPTLRVRQLLSTLNPVETAALKKLLPRKLTCPEEPEGTRYPAALLSALPDGEQYSLLGFITEDLLRYVPVDINATTLTAVLAERAPEVTEDAVAKILKSKTTEPYLEHLRKTRIKLRIASRGGPPGPESEIGDPAIGPLVGHPDMRTATQVFEIKMTGQLRKNWPDFIMQVFAYGVLDLAVTDLYLVLPLQEIVHHFPIDPVTWPPAKRIAFRDALFAAAATRIATAAPAAALVAAHHIGHHTQKLRTLAQTVASLPHPTARPYQIFLSGPSNTHMVLNPDDLAAAATAIDATAARLFVHSQYLINLCNPPGSPADAYGADLLIKNLQAAVTMKARGVVVHVGKSTTLPLNDALANMRANIARVLPYATAECPLLLETPAGQGTEVLRTYEEFTAFVASFGPDPRFRICVDTCHVFVCDGGIHPLDFIKRLTTEHPGLLALIHFNDSATPCGSCADRHAYIGQGHLGIEGMTALAEAGTAAAAPMVIEY